MSWSFCRNPNLSSCQPYKFTFYSKCQVESNSSYISLMLALQAKSDWWVFFQTLFLWIESHKPNVTSRWQRAMGKHRTLLQSSGCVRLTTEVFTPHNMKLKCPWTRHSYSLQKYSFKQRFLTLASTFPDDVHPLCTSYILSLADPKRATVHNLLSAGPNIQVTIRMRMVRQI